MTSASDGALPARCGSAEAQTGLTRLYNRAIGGTPDPSSLAVWTSAMGNGATLPDVRSGFARSAGAQLVPNADASLTAATSPEAFDFTSLTFGHDSIAGFDPTQDAIRLSSGLVDSFATTPAVGGATLITFDASHSLTLDGVAPASLGAANFRFV